MKFLKRIIDWQKMVMSLNETFGISKKVYLVELVIWAINTIAIIVGAIAKFAIHSDNGSIILIGSIGAYVVSSIIIGVYNAIKVRHGFKRLNQTEQILEKGSNVKEF